ncbi:glycosyltransferase family 2 protein [Candidatus Uhrbacteria bacterium]|nr:glycosyltransferase family 2 protein [Candidatus Uhrbacteria bacterium]
MDEAKRLVVNIVTWNSRWYLPGLFASLDDQETREFTVTVVDNASNDGTPTWLQEQRPDAVLLRNARNQGFARAHNQAITLALSRWEHQDLDRRYVLVANPDLEFSPGALRILTAYMEAHPSVGSCGPKLLRAFVNADIDPETAEATRSDQIDSMGLCIFKSRRVVDRGAGEIDRGQYDDAPEVFGLSGACVLYRASALLAAKTGEEFFDEDFFAYKEDVDLAWRLRSLGFDAHVVPNAVVWHYRRVPSSQDRSWLGALQARRFRSPFVNFLSTRNHGWTIVKNDRLANLMLHLSWWLPYEIAKAVAGLFSFSQLKGQATSFIGFPKMIAKRFKLRPAIKTSDVDIRKWFI